MTSSRLQILLITTASLICMTPVDSQLSLRGQAVEVDVNEPQPSLYRVRYSNGNTRILREQPQVWCCTCENDCEGLKSYSYCECTCSCDARDDSKIQMRKIPKGDDDEHYSSKSSKGDDDEYSKSTKGDKYKESKSSKGGDEVDATLEDGTDHSESSSLISSKGDDDGSGGDDDSKSTNDDGDDNDENNESTKGDDDEGTDGGDDGDSGKEPTNAPDGPSPTKEPSEPTKSPINGENGPSPTKEPSEPTKSPIEGENGPYPTNKPTKEPTSEGGSDKQCQIVSTDDASLSDREVARVADDFVPESDGFVTKITFYGTYVVSGTSVVGTPTPSDLFHVTYYKDDGSGLPGNVQGGPFFQFDEDTPLTLTITGPEETDERIANSATMFKYEATHDQVAVTAGETYWIEIFNVSGDDSQWFWVHSLDGNLRAVADGPPLNGYGEDDIEEGHDLAFCLNVPFTVNKKDSSKDSEGNGKNVLSATV